MICFRREFFLSFSKYFLTDICTIWNIETFKAIFFTLRFSFFGSHKNLISYAKCYSDITDMTHGLSLKNVPYWRLHEYICGCFYNFTIFIIFILKCRTFWRQWLGTWTIACTIKWLNQTEPPTFLILSIWIFSRVWFIFPIYVKLMCNFIKINCMSFSFTCHIMLSHIC